MTSNDIATQLAAISDKLWQHGLEAEQSAALTSSSSRKIESLKTTVFCFETSNDLKLLADELKNI